MERYSKRTNVIVTKKRIRTNKTSKLDEVFEEEILEPELYEEDSIDFKFFELVLKSIISKQYASSSTLEVYLILLKKFEDLSEPVVHALARMFHRIAVGCDMMYLFYNLDWLDTFNDILQNRVKLLQKSKKYQELIDFVNYCTRCFFKQLEKDPNLFVDVFFENSLKSETSRVKSGERNQKIEISINSDLQWMDQLYYKA